MARSSRSMWPSETLFRAVRSSSSGTTDPRALTDPAAWLSRLRPATDCLDSGQRQEQLLHRLGVHGVCAIRLGQALLQAARDDGEPGLVQGVVHRRELGDDVGAVAALFDHAQDAAD